MNITFKNTLNWWRVLLIALLVQISLPAVAGETFTYTYKGTTLKYEITSATTCQVIKGNYGGAVEIPSKAQNGTSLYVVTSIGEDAFWDCKSLTSVTIPNSVTSIGGMLSEIAEV